MDRIQEYTRPLICLLSFLSKTHYHNHAIISRPHRFLSVWHIVACVAGFPEKNNSRPYGNLQSPCEARHPRNFEQFHFESLWSVFKRCEAYAEHLISLPEVTVITCGFSCVFNSSINDSVRIYVPNVFVAKLTSRLYSFTVLSLTMQPALLTNTFNGFPLCLNSLANSKTFFGFDISNRCKWTSSFPKIQIEIFHTLKRQKSITVIEEFTLNLKDLSCDAEMHIAVQINDMAIS